MRLEPLLALLLIGSVCACSTPGKFVDAKSRLHAEASSLSDTLQNQNLIAHDEDAQAYVRLILNKLYGESAQAIQVYFVDLPSINAFSLANGAIYLHLGLVTQIENESQLAFILSHESEHYLRQHALRQRDKMLDPGNIANTLRYMGLPVIGDLLAASAIAGFSRDMESEADTYAIKQLEHAGYDASAAITILQNLADEAMHANQRSPLFFASHPKLADRIHALSKPQTAIQSPESGFAEKMASIKSKAFATSLRFDKTKRVIRAITRRPQNTLAPYEYFHLGQALRQQYTLESTQLAIDAYLKAAESNSYLDPALFFIGTCYLHLEKSKLAKDYLTRYIEATPGGRYAKYAKYYLEGLNDQ